MKRSRRGRIPFGRLTIFLFLFWGFLPFSKGPAGAQSDAAAGSGSGREQTARPEDSRRDRIYDDYARFMAGMKNKAGILAAREDSPAWMQAADFFNRSWSEFRRSHLDPMKAWAAQDLQIAAVSRPPLFYPFSGPDFASMYSLFGHSRTYLMIALDPVGKIPDFAAMDEAQMASFFASLQYSLFNLLHLGFFKTKDLSVDLKAKELEGVLPLLLFSMARENLDILDIRYWSMSPQGLIKESPAANREPYEGEDIPGVKISFRSGPSQEPQILYYFRCDLSNGSLKRKGHFIAFLNGFGGMTSLLKAASYLMFDPGFSIVREFTLDRSLHLLQTDSGIPLKYFEPSVWKLKFFGTYTGPIPLFKSRYQENLAERYRTGTDISALPFGIGYHFRVNTSNLMFAVKKG